MKQLQMFEKKLLNLNLENSSIAIPIVLLAGIIWSFGPLVVRNIDDAHLFPWQYLFTRGLVIFFLLNCYLYFTEGLSFIKNYLRVGSSGIIGGLGLASAMMSFIWSITNTTAAVTLLMLAAMPFITAILGFIFLKEKISITTWTSIVIASIGIFIMATNSFKIGSLFGLLFGLISALGFSIFSVSLRWKRDTPKFTTVAIAGFVCSLVSAAVLFKTESSFLSSSKNEILFSLHGSLVCIGLIFYSIGSRHVQAAELTLLSLTEIIGGIFWVWLPIFGINEVPSANTIIGGFLIFFALLYYSLLTQRNRRFIALN